MWPDILEFARLYCSAKPMGFVSRQRFDRSFHDWKMSNNQLFFLALLFRVPTTQHLMIYAFLLQVLEKYKSFEPDLNVLPFCSQFIPMDVIDHPKHGSIIYHPSILPKHRGASAINWYVVVVVVVGSLPSYSSTGGPLPSTGMYSSSSSVFPTTLLKHSVICHQLVDMV